jgi:hypothetical protein
MGFVMAASVVTNTDGFNLPPLDKEDGSSFGWFDRLVFGWRDGKVFDYSDWEARDLYEMLKKDYKARQIENVLALPIISATRSITKAKGDKGEYEWLQNYWDHDRFNGGCKTPLDMIVDQMTSAFAYKKAFFEKVWTEGTGDFEGKVVYDKLAWRPQTTCRLMRDPKHGDFRGFEQEAYYVGPEITKGHWPIQVKPKRAFVYIHGQYRDPLNGTSDMEIAYWAWKTKQKILFLWFQFLEGVSLPRTVVKANDQGVASQVAHQISRLKSSGILPIATPSGPESVGIDTLDSSGKGADQFQAAVTWLDQAATNSVLAGFLNLTNNEKSGGGWALSKDSSDFFLQMEEAKAREMETQIRMHLFAPLIRYNFGRDAVIPHFKFEPLNDVDKATSVRLLEQFLGQRDPALIPTEFVAELAKQVADYAGLDGDKVYKQFVAQAKKVQAQAAAQGGAMAGPQGQQIAGVAGATNAAAEVLRQFGGGQGQTPTEPGTAKVVNPNKAYGAGSTAIFRA